MKKKNKLPKPTAFELAMLALLLWQGRPSAHFAKRPEEFFGDALALLNKSSRYFIPA